MYDIAYEYEKAHGFDGYTSQDSEVTRRKAELQASADELRKQAGFIDTAQIVTRIDGTRQIVISLTADKHGRKFSTYILADITDGVITSKRCQLGSTTIASTETIQVTPTLGCFLTTWEKWQHAQSMLKQLQAYTETVSITVIHHDGVAEVLHDSVKWYKLTILYLLDLRRYASQVEIELLGSMKEVA